ncbi:MAG: hypothetical protein ACREPY_15095 [Rhodanobacteraceae bacterium]
MNAVLSGGADKSRNRRTKADTAQSERQIRDELEADHPQSVRHVFYRMTDPRLPVPIEKSEHGYKQVQHRTTVMRRAGLLPYGWITDATRRGYFTDTYRTGGGFVYAMAGLYRGTLWEQADHHVEVWCESRSIAGTIQGTCRELAVSLYPAGGFTSLTLAYESAHFINGEANGRPVEIIYIGDYDPAGVLIDQSIERELRQHLDLGITLNFHRIAITREQVERLDLPTKPRKPGERRVRELTYTVEAEAMPAHIMRDLLRDTVEAFLPSGALERVKGAEESERDGLKRLGLLLDNYPDVNDLCDAVEGQP